MRLEHRYNITFLDKEGNGPKVIRERMLAVYGVAEPSEYEMKYWSKQLKWGRESIEDEPRPGRPV